MKANKYKFNICSEFDCNQEYALKELGIDCKGEFWRKICEFHGEHIELNEQDEKRGKRNER